jgi:hypothetical protein
VVTLDRLAQVDRAAAVATDRFLSAVAAAGGVVPVAQPPEVQRQVAAVEDRLDCGQSASNIWSSLSRWSLAGAVATAA